MERGDPPYLIFNGQSGASQMVNECLSIYWHGVRLKMRSITPIPFTFFTSAKIVAPLSVPGHKRNEYHVDKMRVVSFLED